jgi:tRNA (guanine-N7-)-methyltransferase
MGAMTNEQYTVPGVRSFVLRAGRMSDAQRRSYRELAPRYVLPYGSDLRFDPRAAFGNDNPYTVEIGFGMGTSTAQIAEENPARNYLGLEVHTPGVGKLLWEIERRGLENLRIIEHDAVEVVRDMIADDSVAAFHIFFPDPWPKKRHHKRRLVKRPFTDLLARKLMSGGYLYMATDWVEYGDWALAELASTPGLDNRYAAFAPRQEWRPETRFERKGLDKEHEIRELMFIKAGGEGRR